VGEGVLAASNRRATATTTILNAFYPRPSAFICGSFSFQKGLGFPGQIAIFRPRMQIEPIGSGFSARATQRAMEAMREYGRIQAERRLAGANILRELGKAVASMEAERARNAEMFDKFRKFFGS
jgi:hypothetical protein